MNINSVLFGLHANAVCEENTPNIHPTSQWASLDQGCQTSVLKDACPTNFRCVPGPIQLQEMSTNGSILDSGVLKHSHS